MIKNKQDLRDYLYWDRIALGKGKAPKLVGDYIYKFQIALRKCEYYRNTGIKNPFSVFYAFQYKRLSVKLGFTIPLNVFDKGLSIAHYGTIVVHPAAHVGRNCRIHEGVTIGATNGMAQAAEIGDNVFLASGAKIIGGISIASDVAVGANAVVVKDISESGTTWGGVPAHKISNHNSRGNLNANLFN
ncbi:serine O-acetyltransferase [Bacillus sp. SORGH_AS 510]|uniref:serine acetyltransferase n=1 Tax=Bacillus sp. SORGH_AS_0510 TaxID=3041771 RepID=UPI002784AD4D|nr:serine acetyltransferase [Bacillus sp. SORGH_AS_0510]MDQ1143768.1 serine O-acetyltransferase [Bacillus sp. SORGH_AS_0510]